MPVVVVLRLFSARAAWWLQVCRVDEIADLLGHRQLSMVRRYAHLSVESKKRLVDRVFEDVR